MNGIYGLHCEYMKNPMQIDIDRPRLGWKIRAEGQNITQVRFFIKVTDSRDGKIMWDYSEPSDRTVHIEYAGSPLMENRRYLWSVKSILSDGRELMSEEAFFETGLWARNTWKNLWIKNEDREDLGNCPVFRKSFVMNKPCTRAKLFISARGLYQVSVNGVIREEYVLAPGWTNYNHHQQYLAYDVTEQIKEGENVIGVRLGDGWFDGEISFNHQVHVYGKEISFAAILILEQEDEEIRVVTGTDWKTNTSGILKSSIYDGEIWDLTREPKDWDCPGFDDSGWKPAGLAEDTQAKMVGMLNEGTKRIEIIQPAAIIKAPNGDTLIDMGQNMTGWVRITADGNWGDTVRIKHGEVLDGDGNFYSGNLRRAKQEDVYTLREGKNILEPHFTYHGFRYIHVLEFPGEVKKEYFEGVVLHTGMEPAIQFRCSDELINQLQHNLVWGQKGNFLDVPTDCPQRDERLGWTGDAEIFCQTACYNFSSDAFFTKWLEDVKADQYANGAVPFVVPDVLPKDWRFLTEAGIGPDHVSAAWGDAVIICPWVLYLSYGDVGILEKTYDSMTAYIQYIYKGAFHGSGNPYLWDWGPQLGDWLALDNEEGSYRGGTDERYISTAYYAYSAKILSRCAGILGKEEDRKHYAELYENIRDNFKARYMKDGKILIQTQTAQVLALYFGLLNEEEEQHAADSLVSLLHENNNHLTTGFVGTPYLCHVLSRYGHTDLAYTLLMQKDFPSWLYQVTQGATTIWEHWDGRKSDGTFWSDSMNSFNHYAYGSIGEWIYRCAAGINTEESAPGFKRIRICPNSDERLGELYCRYHSVHGDIVSSWKREKRHVSYLIQIPVNTTAAVYLENGEIHQVGSGTYEYEIDL